MNTEQERLLLAGLLKRCAKTTAPKPADLRVVQLRILAAVLISVLTLSAALALGHFSPAILVAISFGTGLIVMFFVLWQVSSTKWPILKPFIDTTGIRDRLRELGG